MIKRWKVVECSFCHRTEIMEKRKDSWSLPIGWKDAGKRTHFCPRCSDAMYKLRISYEPKTEDHGDD